MFELNIHCGRKSLLVGKLAAMLAIVCGCAFPVFGGESLASGTIAPAKPAAAEASEPEIILSDHSVNDSEPVALALENAVALASEVPFISSAQVSLASETEVSVPRIPWVLVNNASDSTQELEMSLNEAVISALQKNRSLAVQRLKTKISRTAIEMEKAAFDSLVAGSISVSDEVSRQINQAGVLSHQAANRADGVVGISRTSPSGTKTEVSLNVERTRSNRLPNLFDTRVGLDLTHPLRRGSGRQVNLVSVRQAELQHKASKHELEGFILALLADVEKKYWDFFLTIQELKIFRESYRIAVMQLEETKKKIALGGIPESEMAAAEAEVALREEGLIDAQSKLETARIALLRVTNPGEGRFWQLRIWLTDLPEMTETPINSPREHVDSAVKRNPELKQAKVLLESRKLEIVQTRNGLLPQLDFFLTLGKTGYARTFERTGTEFGHRPYDLTAGLQFEFSPGRREARMTDQHARFSMEQQKEAIRNLRQIVQEDVLTAYLEVNRSRQQMKATSKTVEKQKEKLRVEEIKFGLGKSTAFQVAQAQRDVADSQIAQLRARIGSLNALTDLWRFDGTLAERLGVTIEGETPKRAESLQPKLSEEKTGSPR